MPCLLLQHLLVPSRYCETHSPKPFAWLCFPSSVPKVRFTCKGPLSKSAAEQHKKFLSSEFRVLFVIKTDCHTSYYLYAASCLEETVWEHFHTEKNFAACFRRKTQIQNLYQSSILLGESLFMLYMPTKENDFTENYQDIPMKQDSSLPKQLGLSLFRFTGKFTEYRQSETKSKQTSSAKALFSWLLGDSCTFTDRT